MQRHHKTGATHRYEGTGGHASWGAEAGFQPGTFGSRSRGFEANPPAQGATEVPEGAQHFFHRKRSDLTPAHSSGLGAFAVSASSDLQRAAAGRLDRLASAPAAAGPPIRWAGASHGASHSRDMAGGCRLPHENLVDSLPGASDGAPTHAKGGEQGEMSAHDAAMESVAADEAPNPAHPQPQPSTRTPTPSTRCGSCKTSAAPRSAPACRRAAARRSWPQSWPPWRCDWLVLISRSPYLTHQRTNQAALAAKMASLGSMQAGRVRPRLGWPGGAGGRHACTHLHARKP